MLLMFDRGWSSRRDCGVPMPGWRSWGVKACVRWVLWLPAYVSSATMVLRILCSTLMFHVIIDGVSLRKECPITPIAAEFKSAVVTGFTVVMAGNGWLMVGITEKSVGLVGMF